MPLRLVQVTLPAEDAELELADTRLVARWAAEDGRSQLVQFLVRADRSEAVTDELRKRHGTWPGFSAVLLPVEGMTHELALVEDEAAEDRFGPGRVSREELQAELAEGATGGRVFIALTLLSALVAAIGLLRDDLAVIIGAIVIAPLLGPNVALALATTLGDASLVRRALRTNVLGAGLALAIGLLLGLVLRVDPTVPALVARTRVGAEDVVLALASGVAGTLCFTAGLSGAVIGVMVAVALMPPIVTLGLFLASGRWDLALGAGMLLAVNVIGLNLAGVATFVIQGVRPITWWEAERARRSTRRAVLTWVLLLAVFLSLLLAGKGGVAG